MDFGDLVTASGEYHEENERGREDGDCVGCGSLDDAVD